MSSFAHVSMHWFFHVIHYSRIASLISPARMRISFHLIRRSLVHLCISSEQLLPRTVYAADFPISHPFCLWSLFFSFLFRSFRPGMAGHCWSKIWHLWEQWSWHILNLATYTLTQPVLRHFSGHESGHIFWHLSWWHIFWRKSFWHILTYIQANAVTCALKEELLQTEAFTDRSFYTEGSFHRVVFTHRNFYTQTRFQRSFRNFIITHHTFFSLNVSTASFIIRHLFIMAHHLLSSYFPLSFDLLPPLGPHCKI